MNQRHMGGVRESVNYSFFQSPACFPMEQDGALPHPCVLAVHGSLPLCMCVCVCESAGMSTCVLLGHSDGFQHITDYLYKDVMAQREWGLGSLLIS